MLIIALFSVLVIREKSNVTEIKTETVTRAAPLKQETVYEKITDPNDIVKYGTKSEELLNKAELKPMLTNDKELDFQVTEIFDELVNESMSNYEKVLAIYDYFQTKFYYRSSYIASEMEYLSFYDGRNVNRAKGFLTTGHGTCTEFSAAFMVVMRALGFECYTVEGRFGSGRHTWNVIVLNGQRYIFDSQIDFRQRDRNTSETSTKFFCIDSSYDLYKYYHANNEDGDISSFNNFETAEEEETTNSYTARNSLAV